MGVWATIQKRLQTSEVPVVLPDLGQRAVSAAERQGRTQKILKPETVESGRHFGENKPQADMHVKIQ